MSIKFVCSCGKHLRARDEMAARRSMCPRCGSPVGVPSMRPTHTGTVAAPLTPEERRRLNKDKAVGWAECSRPTSGGAVGLEDSAHPTTTKATPSKQRAKTPRIRRRRQLERQWYQCLAYPLLNWMVLLVLSLVSSVWLAGIVLGVPNLPGFSFASQQEILPWGAVVLSLVFMVGYSYSSVECALTTALAGEGAAPYWPGWRAAFPFKSALRWLICFLAGPIVPTGLAVYFVIYGGDLTPLDWGIVAELCVAAAGYWFLAIVSANERNRLLDAHPLRVGQLVQRLKYRALVPALGAPALAFAHALLGFFALATLHESVPSGWFMLFCCWGSALFWSAFLFRLLGVWCYRNPSPSEPRP